MRTYDRNKLNMARRRPRGRIAESLNGTGVVRQAHPAEQIRRYVSVQTSLVRLPFVHNWGYRRGVAQKSVEGLVRRGLPLDGKEWVVLHLLADCRRFDDGRDVERRKLAGASDTTQEKQLRSIDGTGGKNDLLVGARGVVDACDNSIK